MNRMLLVYELRRIGWAAIGGPPLALAVLGAFAVLAAVFGAPEHVNRILSAGLDVLPLVGGITAATVVAGDRALELHLTFPTSYRSTLMRRFALALGWTMLMTLVTAAVLVATNRLVWPITPLSDQLIWLAPLLWLAGVGVMSSLGARGAVVGSGIVGVLWVFEQVFSGLFVTIGWLQPLWLFARWDAAQTASWYINRSVLLVSALALLVLAYLVLGRPECLLTGENT